LLISFSLQLFYQSCDTLTKKFKARLVNDNTVLITVNEKQEYHNCEMIFYFYNNDENGFRVTKDQKYKIHTTIKEVEALNEALNVYQADGFKEKYLLYNSVMDGSDQYPEFAIDYIDSVQVCRTLQSLANDEDSLVQLSEYCLDVAPTYKDDFMINKRIESVIVGSHKKEIEDYDDLEEYMAELKEKEPTLFN